MERVAVLAQTMLAGWLGAPPHLLSAQGTYIIPSGDGAPFRMVTTGVGLVISVCPELMDWSRRHLAGIGCADAFEAHGIAGIERALRKHAGSALKGPYQVFYGTPGRYDIPDSPINRNFRLFTVSGAELPQYVNPGLFETGLRQTRPNSLFELAFVDNKPLGVCGGTPNPQNLLSLCVEVLPEWQSRGIGTWMARHALNSLAASGHYAYCRVPLADLRSIRLCLRLDLRLGWLELVGERDPASGGDVFEDALKAEPWDPKGMPRNGRTQGS